MHGPGLHDGVTSKSRLNVDVLGMQDVLAAFREEMAEDIIPAVYGGPNGLHLYESKPELELQQLVQRLNGQKQASGSSQDRSLG